MVSTYKTSSRWCYIIKCDQHTVCDKHIRGKHASTLQRTLSLPPKFSSNLTQKLTSLFPQESTTTSYINSGQTLSSNFRPQFKPKSTFYPLVKSTKLNIFTRNVGFGIENLLVKTFLHKERFLKSLSNDNEIVTEKQIRGCYCAMGKVIVCKRCQRKLHSIFISHCHKIQLPTDLKKFSQKPKKMD